MLPPNPSEVLNGPKARQVFAALRENFDRVLVDSPPVLPVTDAMVLSTYADGTLVVAAGQTRQAALHRTAERFAQAKAPLVGIALNQVTKENGYGYEYTSSPGSYAAEPSRAALLTSPNGDPEGPVPVSADGDPEGPVPVSADGDPEGPVPTAADGDPDGPPSASESTVTRYGYEYEYRSSYGSFAPEPSLAALPTSANGHPDGHPSASESAVTRPPERRARPSLGRILGRRDD